MKIDRLMGHSRAQTLFNAVIAADKLDYKPLSEDAFHEKFFGEQNGVTKINIGATDDASQELLGFGCACFRDNAEVCYISFVAVEPSARRGGIGAAIVKALEEACLTENPQTKKFEIVFFNPMQFEWIVPGTDGHDHPGAPGVDVTGGAYKFFEAVGYATYVLQNSFYRLLREFRFSDDITGKLEALREKGVEICYYDKAKHSGWDELFDNLGSEGWRSAIMGNLALDKPDPVLIVAKGAQIGGFTGPLRVQESGRGYFAGIGVHSDFRGGGAGKALFSALCMGLKEMGAEYMTLFTGETNPARNIYLSAGFEIVKTWADMRKVVQ